ETAQEKVLDAYDYARDKNDDTVGSQVTRKLHSSAGDLAEDQIRQAMALLANAAAKGEVIAVDDPRITRLVKLTYDYSELFIKARSETADLVANIAINAASFVIPGGVSLKLLLLATGGGLLKVGIQEGISGDASVSDFFSGFANVGMNAFVPAHLARAAKLGEKVAFETGKAVAKNGAEYLAKGVEEKLAQELMTAASTAFAHGGGTIENKVLNGIVNKYAKEGATDVEKAALRQILD